MGTMPSGYYSPLLGKKTAIKLGSQEERLRAGGFWGAGNLSVGGSQDHAPPYEEQFCMYKCLYAGAM